MLVSATVQRCSSFPQPAPPPSSGLLLRLIIVSDSTHLGTGVSSAATGNASASTVAANASTRSALPNRLKQPPIRRMLRRPASFLHTHRVQVTLRQKAADGSGRTGVPERISAVV